MLLSFVDTMDYEFIDLWAEVRKSSSQNNATQSSCVLLLI